MSHYGQLVTTTSMEAKPCFGSPSTKSMLKPSQDLVGKGSGVYNPLF